MRRIEAAADSADLLKRLRKADWTSGVVCRPRADRAISAHLWALGIAGMPIRWVADLREGLSIAGDRHWHDAWNTYLKRESRADAVWWPIPFWTIPEGLPPVGNWSGPWRAAETIVRLAVAGPTSAGRLPVPCAKACWSALWAEDHRIFAPFVTAYESGLWCVWVLRDEVVAVSRPRFSMSGDLLHGDVEWPKGLRLRFWKGVEVPPDFDVEAARVPVHEDRFGVLYRVGSVTVVRVRDHSGEHDLRVPSNIHQAKEAVAWTFGMSAECYRPRVET